MATTEEHRVLLAKVEAALDELGRQEAQAFGMPHGSNSENAERALRIAAVSARKAAWWKVLSRRMPYESNRLYYMAVLAAVAEERGHARFWRDTAADWAARAANVPTSDAAGALSNWHELGVSA